MRGFLCSLVLLAAGCGAAHAGAKITTKTTYYDISGPTGQVLLEAMDRKGPKHGFLTRAIAQTQYTMESHAEWRQANGVCRPENVKVTLAITYVYPRQVGKPTQAMRQRWERFISGVRKHEGRHGEIAREMARAADRAISRMTVRGGSGCGRANGEMRRTVNAVVAEYEKRQVRFDQVEHGDGGNVEGLVRGLLGSKRKG